MKTTSELTDFYYRVLFPTLEKLEDDRKQLRKKVFSVGFFYTSIILIIIFAMRDIIAQSLDILAFIGIGYFGVGVFIYKFLIGGYVSEFKDKIIKPLIHEIDRTLKYTSKLHVPQHLFERSKLFLSDIDRMSGNDFVRGEIDKIPIQFSDIHAEKRHRDSKGRENWSTVFQGLFIVSEFNKNFSGDTIILPDVAQSSFGDLVGGWLQSNNLSREELVKMDDPEFEKEFVVYSNDQIEARYILTHSLMSKLLIFKRKSKHPLYVSFVKNHIHIAVEYNKDLFEPSVFHSLLKYKIAMEYIGTLHLAIGIVEELKLNQKLWSKK